MLTTLRPRVKHVPGVKVLGIRVILVGAGCRLLPLPPKPSAPDFFERFVSGVDDRSNGFFATPSIGVLAPQPISPLVPMFP